MLRAQCIISVPSWQYELLKSMLFSESFRRDIVRGSGHETADPWHCCEQKKLLVPVSGQCDYRACGQMGDPDRCLPERDSHASVPVPTLSSESALTFEEDRPVRLMPSTVLQHALISALAMLRASHSPTQAFAV